jgi:hypothetical protein
VSFPLPLAHTSDGTYQTIIPYGAIFLAGHTYEAVVLAIGSQGYRAQWTEKLIAKVRRA